MFLQTVVGSEKPGSDSFLRYMLIHDTILQYQQTNTLIGDAEALNITAVRESICSVLHGRRSPFGPFFVCFGTVQRVTREAAPLSRL